LIVAIALGALRARAAPLDGFDPPGPLPELVYRIETDKPVYQLGEEVHITHRAMNLGDADVTIRFTCEPGFRFDVVTAGERVEPWLWVLSARVWSLTLSPGESYESEWTWDMADSDGNPVLPGTYDILGLSHGTPVMPVGASSPDDPVTSITIVPEPAMVGLLSLGFGILLRRRKDQFDVPSLPGVLEGPARRQAVGD